jgi:hypothetical protein
MLHENQIAGPGAHRVNSPIKSFTIGNGHTNGQQAHYHQGHDFAFMDVNPQQILGSNVGAQYGQEVYAGILNKQARESQIQSEN